MKVKLALVDWKKIGESNSIYNTPLGVELSSGDLHSGSVFEAEISFVDNDTLKQIEKNFKIHRAYPVFSLIPEK
jgi:hypothetical protein